MSSVIPYELIATTLSEIAISNSFNVYPVSVSISTIVNETVNTPFIVTVSVFDIGGVIASGLNGDILLSFGSSISGSTIVGNTNITTTAGIASFNISITKSGLGYQLKVQTPLFSQSLLSNLFTIIPSSITFSTQPSGGLSGNSLTTQPIVQLKDGSSIASGFTGSVSISIKTGSGTSGAVLSGTTSLSSVGGIATFTGLSINKAGSNYELIASSYGLSITSNNITITQSTSPTSNSPSSSQPSSTTPQQTPPPPPPPPPPPKTTSSSTSLTIQFGSYIIGLLIIKLLTTSL